MEEERLKAEWRRQEREAAQARDSDESDAG